MILESFLTKIASTIFKKALIGGLIKSFSTAYEIYSTFDTLSELESTIDSSSDCNSLKTYGIKVASESLTKIAFNKIVSIGSQSFIIEKTESGIYIASNNLTPSFKISKPSFPDGVFAGGRSDYKTGGSGGFRSGGRGEFY